MTHTHPAEDLCLIWSGEHNAYWRPGAAGYTVRASGAGIYTRTNAEALTSHCGPEKKIEFEPVPNGWNSRTAPPMAAVLSYLERLLPSAAGLQDAPDLKVIAFYLNLGELRGLRTLIALAADEPPKVSD